MTRLTEETITYILNRCDQCTVIEVEAQRLKQLCTLALDAVRYRRTLEKIIERDSAKIRIGTGVEIRDGRCASIARQALAERE